jgi:hypothetical protein
MRWWQFWKWPFWSGGVAAPPLTGVIVLGGRRFVPLTESTLAHDTWYKGLVFRNGMHTMVRGSDESESDYGLRLLAALHQNGYMWELLGGLLLPEGTSHQHWTPEVSAEITDFIGHLDDPAEKERAYPLARELWWGFFARGRNSSRSSPPSSPVEEELTGLLAQMSATASGAR